jgi:hypothetical protein
VSSVRYYDDLSVLPAEEREWSGRRRSLRFTEEELAIYQAVRVLAKHAVEAGDQRMAGRVMAAAALTGTNVYWLYDDCRDLLGTELPEWDGTHEHATRRGELLTEAARAFFVAGVRRRPARLLRAEARGLLFALRWLFRAGLLPMASLAWAEQQPWRRVTGAPVDAHPHILGPLPPAAANLN